MRPRRVRLGYEVARGAGAQVVTASMRPRRVRLGYSATNAQLDQFDLGFNEAEARTPRIHGPRRARAARRHDASMRPRRVRLGYPPSWTRIMPVEIQASMRPRRVRLGYPPRQYRRGGAKKELQ